MKECIKQKTNDELIELLLNKKDRSIYFGPIIPCLIGSFMISNFTEYDFLSIVFVVYLACVFSAVFTTVYSEVHKKDMDEIMKELKIRRENKKQ